MIVFTFNVYTISSPHWVNKQDKELKKNHRGRHCGTELKPHFGMMTFIIGVLWILVYANVPVRQ